MSQTVGAKVSVWVRIKGVAINAGQILVLPSRRHSDWPGGPTHPPGLTDGQTAGAAG